MLPKIEFPDWAGFAMNSETWFQKLSILHLEVMTGIHLQEYLSTLHLRFEIGNSPMNPVFFFGNDETFKLNNMLYSSYTQASWKWKICPLKMEELYLVYKSTRTALHCIGRNVDPNKNVIQFSKVYVFKLLFWMKVYIV